MIEDLPALAELPVPLIVSVMAPEPRGVRPPGRGRRPNASEVAAIELNVSCPNVKSGLIVGEQPAETAALLETLRPLTEKPLIVKLTPNVADPAAVAVAAEEGGADAVSLINTLRASARDPVTLEPWLGAGAGGLSGPAIKAIALDQVPRVAGEVSLPVIGMGGIESGADALEFLVAGASAIAVGTASFRDPMAAARVRLGARRSSSEAAVWTRLPGVRTGVHLNLRSKRISPKTRRTPLARCGSGYMIAAVDGPLRRDPCFSRPGEDPRAADARAAAGERDPHQSGRSSSATSRPAR